jgi:hypothetical protein
MENYLSIGILVSSLVQRHQKLIKKLSAELASDNCNVYLFSGKSIKDKYIKGYQFNSISNTWEITKFNVALDVIYNRISTKASEIKFYEEHSHFIDLNKDKIVNPYFFSKWDIYKILSSSDILRNYSLDSNNKWSRSELESYLIKYGSLYCKNEYNSQGKGIFKLSRLSNNSLLFESFNKKLVFANVDTFLKTYKQNLNDSYIYQEACQTLLVDGCKWDYRILAHLDSSDKFSVSGVGIRMASKDSNLLTHTLNNGTIIEYKDFPYKINLDLLSNIIEQLGNALRDSYGNVGEFSVDLGLCEDNNYKIYEINSKPMIFDEHDIQNIGISNLKNMLIHYSNTLKSAR